MLYSLVMGGVAGYQLQTMVDSNGGDQYPNAFLYVLALVAMAACFPLPISDNVSASSSTLFTGAEPPRLLLTIAHRIFNDLVHQISMVAHRAEQWVVGGQRVSRGRRHFGFELAVQSLHLLRRKGSDAIEQVIKFALAHALTPFAGRIVLDP
ncbi:MAG: hypothetical protein ACLQVF_39530 [Isosphaeraceae bacterium]